VQIVRREEFEEANIKGSRAVIPLKTSERGVAFCADSRKKKKSRRKIHDEHGSREKQAKCHERETRDAKWTGPQGT